MKEDLKRPPIIEEELDEYIEKMKNKKQWHCLFYIVSNDFYFSNLLI